MVFKFTTQKTNKHSFQWDIGGPLPPSKEILQYLGWFITQVASVMKTASSIVSGSAAWCSTSQIQKLLVTERQRNGEHLVSITDLFPIEFPALGVTGRKWRGGSVLMCTPDLTAHRLHN